MPSNVLLDQVFRERWQQVVDRVATHPYEAHYREYGSTALHWAVSRKAPFRAVRTILAAYPKATTIQDINGSTPLHIAASKLHKVSCNVVKMLVEANAQAVFMRDKYGRTPLQYMCWTYESNIRDALDCAQESGQTVHGFLAETRLNGFWNKACTLAKAASFAKHVQSSSGSSSRIWSIVHTLIRTDDCPLDLLKLAMKLHPLQLLESDESGNFPLHVAAEVASEECFRAVSFFCVQSPQIARARNQDGKLPLFLALKSGKTWEVGVKDVLEAFPGAVTDRDDGSGLFPFMVAAVENASLTSIYDILRACPELTRFAHNDKKLHRRGHFWHICDRPVAAP